MVNNKILAGIIIVLKKILTLIIKFAYKTNEYNVQNKNNNVYNP